MNTYTISNSYLTAKFTTLGAELISLQNMNNREYIWSADPKFWKRHSPVLFPLVGKYKDNKCIYQGKSYELPQHGFARDMDFQLFSQKNDEIWFRLVSNEETLAKYPFSFELLCGYVLENKRLTVKWKVINSQEETMYFSIGAHPAFAPAPDAKNMVGYAFKFYGNEEDYTYGLLSSSGLLLDDSYEITLDRNKTVKITSDMFDEDAWVLENRGTTAIGLVDTSGTEFLKVHFNTPVYGLWSPAKSDIPFVCIEPWYGRCDRQDFHGELQEREWGNTLEAGREFQGEYTIEVV